MASAPIFRPRNAKGHLLGHAKDRGRDTAAPEVRCRETKRELDLRTDRCGIVGPLCLRTAKAGGGRAARQAPPGIIAAEMAGLPPSSEPHAPLLARRLRERLGADWGFAEREAAGPSGNRHGDPARHACLAVVERVERAVTLGTCLAGSEADMRAFVAASFRLAAAALA